MFTDLSEHNTSTSRIEIQWFYLQPLHLKMLKVIIFKHPSIKPAGAVLSSSTRYRYSRRERERERERESGWVREGEKLTLLYPVELSNENSKNKFQRTQRGYRCEGG